MSAIQMLALQAAHRDTKLQEVAQRLESDGRFSAAWLVGSLADRSADGLSDIDLLVIIDDKNSEDVLGHSTEEVARFGQIAWLKDVPGNAPSGGAYVSVGFESSPLPIGVDWYWQPLREAVFPSDAHFLFQKEPIPSANPPASFAELMSRRSSPIGTHRDRQTPSELDRVAFFWAMVPVAAKYGARGWDEKAGLILGGLEEQVDMMSALAAGNHRPAAVTSPLQRLRLLIDRMDRHTPTLRARGIPIPDTSYAFAIVRLAEGLEQEGWHGRTGLSANASSKDR